MSKTMIIAIPSFCMLSSHEAMRHRAALYFPWYDNIDCIIASTLMKQVSVPHAHSHFGVTTATLNAFYYSWPVDLD